MPPELKETEDTPRPALITLPNKPPRGALAALMEQWQAEDAALSEEEKIQADKDLAEFKANLNANREATGERPVYR